MTGTARCLLRLAALRIVAIRNGRLLRLIAPRQSQNTTHSTGHSTADFRLKNDLRKHILRTRQINTTGFVLMAALTSHFVHAEGSYQVGLNQPFVEYGATIFGNPHTEPLHVDIRTAGEVINISLCGNEDAHDVQAEVYDPQGNLVETFTHNHGNVACNDPFTAPLPLSGPQGDQGPFQHTTTTTGAYSIRLYNTGFSGSSSDRQLIRRFDITVTPDNTTLPDPAAQGGRLWSRSWSFWTRSFAESEATDANYFPLVPGGRTDTHYVWKLDLNNFSGNLYSLIANDTGVTAPGSGYSVPESGNSVTPKYPIYLSYPVTANPRPTDPPEISGLTFTDDAGIDYGISPGATPGVQDSGVFEFTTDVDGTYALLIDTNGDGQFGASDTLLLGSVVSGSNQISWDGTDANGNTLPPAVYDAQLRVSLGEYHFVTRDAETSGGTEDGLTIFQANADGSTDNTQVYWDDETRLSSPAGTTTLPNGQSSATSAGHHTWGDFTGAGIGNERYIDTYVYGLTVNATTQAAIVLDDVPLNGNDGSVAFSGASLPGSAILITVTDPDLNTSNALVQNVIVQVTNDDTGEQEQVLLTETGPDTAVFSNAITTLPETSAGTNNDGVLNTQGGQNLTVTYYDQLHSAGTGGISRTAQIQVDFDTDNDGITDTLDLDSDNDGIPDSIEGDDSVDSDADGVPDYRDLDSDNDGLFDLMESGISDPATLDSDNDGRIDNSNTVGTNGLADIAETSDDSGSINYSIADTDMDGVADYRDLDSDNDGLFDIAEAGGNDPDNDGLLGNGTPGVDVNGLASGAGLSPIDTDNDSIPDQRDLDSDGDGLFDVTEAGGSDPDNDGIPGSGTPTVGNNGLTNGAGLTLIDTDNDGTPDYIDLDADNDGTPDASDVFPTNSGESADNDGDGTGNNADLDADNDGIPDSIEGDDSVDTDSDGTPDYLDRDSDGDGINDITEAGGTDTNNDGLVDGFTDTDNDGLDDTLAASPLPVTDSDNDGTPDYRDNRDSDGDGILDTLDLDSDNDGLPDSIEGDANVDSDGDGIADLLDLDSDNDGLFDLTESGITDPASLDGNGDGRIDDSNTAGSNGLADVAETSAGSGDINYTVADTDSDGIHDYRDRDADSDDIPDVTEAGGNDPDGDGILGSGTPDVDANGLASGAGLSPVDTDSDGITDNLDLDSDNDGIPDSIEGGASIDSDADGISDYRDLDSDNDGLFDLTESGISDPASLDTNNDGRIDASNAVGTNGLADTVETGTDSGTLDYVVADTDTDTIEDFRDLDSDGDGLFDVIEAGGSDADNDGIPGSGMPGVDANGLANSAGLIPADSDADGTPDQRDLDADNDGTPDASDAFPTDNREIADGDGDGIGNNADLDADNDGIPDSIEGDASIDTDNDGTPDYLDRDSDGDGIDDIIEAGGRDTDNDGQIDDFTDTNNDGLDDNLATTPLPITDGDGDGTPDYRDNADSDADGIVNSLDLDSDNDGIPDSTEGNASVDTDGDGIADYLDLDSDNDGIPDLIESGITDPATLDGDNDGRIDTGNPVGDNGLADAVETAPDSGQADYNADGNADAPRDTDSDGTPDYRDLDSDNDGINDIIEAGGSDTNTDGRIDNPADTNGDGLHDDLVNSPLPDIHTDADSDGISDYRDNDDLDNDGIADMSDLDSDNDGIPDLIEGSDTRVDTDNDGIPDFRDLDSDNDGLFDLTESGISDPASLDTNNDGRIDTGNTVGSNGLANVVETGVDSGSINYTVADTDSDGIDDYRDRDADNDGIPDVTEAGGNDPDGDGVLGNSTPIVDDSGLVTGAGLNPVDTDSDSIPDYRDIDSDGDNITDIIEAGGSDGNSDGQVDDFTDDNNDGLADDIVISPLPLPDSDGNGTPDYRDNGDLDNDGIADTADLDTDNDGIPDLIEGSDSNVDTDGDGIPDYRDLDSDNDGLFDLTESGISDPLSLDTDNDGRIDDSNTVGTNGLADAVETSADSDSINYTIANTDGDNLDDYRDLDSDGDGIPDVTEGDRSDADNDGRIGTNNPRVDFNGVASGSGTTVPDSDNDGVPDYRDLDSDNDSITDVVEAGGTDSDGDARQDAAGDSNNDGFDDAVQAAPLPLYDTDDDGTPDYRDLDSDNDGIPDLSETGAIDRDRNGRVDDFNDADNDGLDDELSGTVPDLPDSNGNGIADYRDPATAKEPKTVRTGLDGLGGCTLSPAAALDPTLPLLLLIALLSLWRRKSVSDKRLQSGK